MVKIRVLHLSTQVREAWAVVVVVYVPFMASFGLVDYNFNYSVADF